MVCISVIIPVYNVENYLKECLESVINQSFEDLEILCINDGSTDSSLNILNEYKNRDSRIQIISQENAGLSAARNTGLNNSTGDYIYFMDSDDYLELEALEEMIKLSKNYDLDLLIFEFINFDDKTGKKFENNVGMQYLNELEKPVFDYKDIIQYLFRLDVTVYTKFFKRELIEDKSFVEGIIFEDNAFFVDYIFDAKRIHYHEKFYYNRRVRDSSIITSSSKNHTDIIKVYNIMNDKLRQKGLYDEFKERLFMLKMNIVNLFYKRLNPECKEYYFNKMKLDFEQKQEEYSKELNFDKINDNEKKIYRNVLDSKNSKEFDLKNS